MVIIKDEHIDEEPKILKTIIARFNDKLKKYDPNERYLLYYEIIDDDLDEIYISIEISGVDIPFLSLKDLNEIFDGLNIDPKDIQLSALFDERLMIWIEIPRKLMGDRDG